MNSCLLFLGLPYIAVLTRARLGRVTPLGRPRSVYKSDIECRFLSRKGQMTLKVMVNDSHFQYHLRESLDAYLVQILLSKPKSVTSYRTEKQIS